MPPRARHQLLGLAYGDGSRYSLGLSFPSDGGEGRAVVFVWVPQRVADDPRLIGELVRESESAARLFHPNVLRVLGLDTVDGQLARVVGYAEGETLRAVLDAGGRLPPELAARIVADACAGVEHAHGKGNPDGTPLVHGDLRPETLLVWYGGLTQVTGYGALPLVEGSEQVRAARRLHSAPEQLGGGPRVALPATDVYLLGVVLYECLAGEPPFVDERDVETAVLEKPPAPLAPLGVPERLADVTAWALSKRPEDRPTSPGVLARAIQDAVGALPARNAVGAYMDLLFPPDAGPRLARQRMLAEAIVGGASLGVPSAESADDLVVGDATIAKASTEASAAPDAVTAADLVSPPAPSAERREEPAPEVVTSADVVAPEPASAHPIHPVTTAEIVVPPTASAPAPQSIDVVTTGDIVAVPEPPAPVAGVPAPVAEIPAPAVEVPAPAAKVPAPAAEIPAPAAEIPAPAAEIPAPAAKVPAPAAEIPAPAAEIPAPAAEIPAPAAEIPAPAAEIPAPAVEVPASRAQIRAAAAEIRAPAVEVPASRAQIPAAAAEIPAPEPAIPAPLDGSHHDAARRADIPHRIRLLTGSLLVAAGIAVGYVLSRGAAVGDLVRRLRPPPISSPVSNGAPAPHLEPLPAQKPEREETPGTAISTAFPTPDRGSISPQPAPAALSTPKPAEAPSIDVSADPVAPVYIDGKRAGKPPFTRVLASGKHTVRLLDPARGIDVRRRVDVSAAHTRVRFKLETGTLTVNAPAEAKVFVDGRLVGTGPQPAIRVYEGAHHVKVTLGSAEASESFDVSPGETWDYDVTPQP